MRSCTEPYTRCAQHLNMRYPKAHSDDLISWGHSTVQVGAQLGRGGDPEVDRHRAQATKSALSTRVYSVYIHGAVLYILLWHVWAGLSPVQRGPDLGSGGTSGRDIYILTTRARGGFRLKLF